jgi:hypothetical protein
LSPASATNSTVEYAGDGRQFFSEEKVAMTSAFLVVGFLILFGFQEAEENPSSHTADTPKLRSAGGDRMSPPAAA